MNGQEMQADTAPKQKKIQEWARSTGEDADITNGQRSQLKPQGARPLHTITLKTLTRIKSDHSLTTVGTESGKSHWKSPS
jgi:hypothetical protein